MGEWALTGGAQHEERCGGPFMAPSRPCGKCFLLLPDTFRGSSMGSFVSRWVVVEKHEQIAHILRTRGTLFDVSLRCLVWHGGRRRPTKATPHPPTHVCRGRGLAVPEVLLIKNFNVGAQIWYHKEPEERGERGLCTVTALTTTQCFLLTLCCTSSLSIKYTVKWGGGLD